MLFVLLLKQTCLLEGWICLLFQLEEPSDDLADVANVLPVLPFVELKLFLEQAMLLLEDSDTGQSVRQDLKSTLEHFDEGGLEWYHSVILHDAPEVRLGLNHSFNLHHKLQDVD